jgi:hypothetical protein
MLCLIVTQYYTRVANPRAAAGPFFPEAAPHRTPLGLWYTLYPPTLFEPQPLSPYLFREFSCTSNLTIYCPKEIFYIPKTDSLVPLPKNNFSLVTQH